MEKSSTTADHLSPVPFQLLILQGKYLQGFKGKIQTQQRLNEPSKHVGKIHPKMRHFQISTSSTRPFGGSS